MASPSAQPVPRERKKSGLDLAEQLIKIGSGFLALVYAAGFLIVSVHHTRYGIVMFEFLRARVFAAGLLYALFLAFPILTMWIAFFIHETNHPRRRRLITIWLGMVSFFWVVALSPWMAGITRPDESFWARFPFRQPVFTFTGWFFVIAFFFILFRVLSKFGRLQTDDWAMVVTLAVVGVFPLASSIYSQVIPAFGGGKPLPVTIHFSHKTAFADSLDVPAYLVDETERGYYVIHRLEDHSASFIPREAIGSVDF